MLYRFVSITILVLMFLFSFSQETKIFGTIPGGDGFEVRLMSYADQLTYQKRISDRTIINEGGGFELIIKTKETIPVFLEVENYSIMMYVESGEIYQLICDSIFPGKDYLPFYNQQQLWVNNISEPEPELNSLISYFDYLYEDFVVNNFERIHRGHNGSVINGFVYKTDSLYSNFRHEFLQNYTQYKIASLKLSVATFKKEEIFKNYLEDQRIFYNNPEYMNFFHQFFDNYISGYNNQFVSREDLYATINQQYSYPAMLDSLGKDTLLRNEKVRELVLIKTLKELFYNPEYSQANINNMLEQVKDNSKFEKHRDIAANTMFQLTRFEQGFPAPAFKLPTLDGDSVSLEDYRGKPVYLSFMTTWSYACLGEFELLNPLYEEYGNSIHFVTISLDKDVEIVNRFCNDKEYYWDFLYNGSHYDLILDYDIKTFPMFILIDRHGKMFEYSAYKPSELIKDSFKKVLKR